ncbi:MAG: spore coat protein SP96 [Raoultibacter sp.]
MAEEINIPTPPPASPQATDSVQPPVQPAPQPEPQPQPRPQPMPQPVQPLYAPAPLMMQMTGGMKFGFCLLGFLMSLPGVLVAWLINADKVPSMKSDALKFSLIGFAVSIVIGILLTMMFVGFIVALVAAAGDASLYSSAYGPDMF